MDIASIVIICFIALFLIIGFISGFMKILIDLLKGLVSLIISFFLAKPIGLWIAKTSIGLKLSGKIETTILNIDPIFSEAVNQENQAELISQGLTKLNIPEFMHEIINKLIGNLVIDTGGNSLAYYCSNAVSNLLFTVLVFIVLSIISIIIFSLIARAFKNLNKRPIAGPINRMLGLLLNGIYAVALVYSILWGIAFLSTLSPEMTEHVNNIFSLNTDKMTLARIMYENNLAVKIYELLI